MSAGQFRAGPDTRRNASGRPRGSKSLSAIIRRQLGGDAEQLIENVRTLALSGDPQAVSAAAYLLGAVVR